MPSSMKNNLEKKIHVDVVSAGKPGLFIRRVALFPSPRKISYLIIWLGLMLFREHLPLHRTDVVKRL